MRTVIITGGTRGIGAATVRRFAKEGDQVHFLYESRDDLAEAISRETGAIGHKCDVADEKQVQAVFAEIGPAEVLVNNAGVVQYGPMNNIPGDVFRRVMDVNAGGMFYCSQAVLPGMLREHRGAIVNVSSMWGRVGSSCEVIYSATKGAVLGLTKAMAMELGPSGIRVNAVAPGVIVTDMVASVSEEVLEGLRQETPLERLGKPEDVADAIWYLASDQASFITGAVLDVNGGFVISG